MKKIEEHTKKELLTIVKDYNLHHSIRNYSLMKKSDLIVEILKHVAYNENTHRFARRTKSLVTDNTQIISCVKV